MARGRTPGYRKPCRMCGASREGEDRNCLNAAVCRRCLPELIRLKITSAHVSLYLGPTLKAQVVAQATAQGVTVHAYIRGILLSNQAN